MVSLFVRPGIELDKIGIISAREEKRAGDGWNKVDTITIRMWVK